MAGAHQEDVSFLNAHALPEFAGLEVVAEDVLPGLEPWHAAHAGDVEQDAGPDETVLRSFHRRSRGAEGVTTSGEVPLYSEPAYATWQSASRCVCVSPR